MAWKLSDSTAISATPLSRSSCADQPTWKVSAHAASAAADTPGRIRMFRAER